LAGEKVELPPLTLTGGGFITGQVVNTVTGEPVTVSENGGPIMLGLYGPSQPAGGGVFSPRVGARGKTGPVTPAAGPREELSVLRQYARRAHGLGHPAAARRRRRRR